MIKFFRKIRQNLLMENKTGKYFKYAIGEIILVVIGILIALSINTWNENRKDGIKEHLILKSLRVNLKENLKLLDLAKKASIDAYNASLKLNELITPNGDKANTNEIDSLISVTLDYFSFDANSGAINEIINSGQLNIIKNEKLKNQISSWSGLINDAQRDVDIANKHAFDKMISYLSKNGNISNLPIGNQYIQNLNLKPKQRSNFKVNYQYLMNSSEFENLISWHSINMIYIINEYFLFKSYLERMVNLIDSEIKEK